MRHPFSASIVVSGVAANLLQTGSKRRLPRKRIPGQSQVTARSASVRRRTWETLIAVIGRDEALGEFAALDILVKQYLIALFRVAVATSARRLHNRRHVRREADAAGFGGRLRSFPPASTIRKRPVLPAEPPKMPHGGLVNRSPTPLNSHSWPTGRIVRRIPRPPRNCPAPPESSTSAYSSTRSGYSSSMASTGRLDVLVMLT